MLLHHCFSKNCSAVKILNNGRTLRNIAYPSNMRFTRNKTVKCVYDYWKLKFLNNHISEPTNSIAYILTHIFQTENISDVYKKFSMKLTNADINKIKKLCELRLKRMPIQYIVGEWNFYGLILKMQPPVFIPRPESEELVNIVLNHLKCSENILEICCGTGAISLALLKSNSNIKITAIDQNIIACELTKKNARIHNLNERLNVIHYKLTSEAKLQEVNEKFDIIVSNPPYVPSEQVHDVQPEIKLYEDLSALDGGVDGLEVIKLILQLASEKLIKGGKLFMETDTSHPNLLRHLVKNSDLGLKYINTFKDFCMKDRFVLLERF